MIEAPGRAVLEEHPPPQPLSDAYLVAVRACGICTWEQRVHRGETGGYPFAPGHEIGAVVVSGPPGGLEAGTVVAVSRLPRCGECDACRDGLDNLCTYLGPSPPGEGPGGLSEYLVAAVADVAPLPPGHTPIEAALVEPLACVLNSLASAGVGPGTRLAVIGNGFMGVLHARAAAAAGAHPTLLSTGPAPAGLVTAWQGDERPLDLADAALSGRTPAPIEGEFDAVIVVRGAPRSVVAAAHLVRPGGLVCIYASLSVDLDISIPNQLMRRKQIGFTAAASHRRTDFAAAARLIGTGAVAVADLVHRSFSLADAQEALSLASEIDSGRVMVTLDGAASPVG